MKRDDLDAILAAATPGRWQRWYDDYTRGTWCLGPSAETAGDVASDVPWVDARAIAVTHNLTPKMLAVVDAAREYVTLHDTMNYPETAAMYPARVRAALADFDAALEGES
jgi:hypothetical protein